MDREAVPIQPPKTNVRFVVPLTKMASEIGPEAWAQARRSGAVSTVRALPSDLHRIFGHRRRLEEQVA